MNKILKTAALFGILLTGVTASQSISTFKKASAEDAITVNKDNESSYTPTQIINGDFEDTEAIYATNLTERRGIDEGWTTTDSWFETLTIAKCDEWGVMEPEDKGIFAEMNADNAAVLYQDLTTYGGDVIRWTLDHAARCDGADPQTMEVHIGASDGNDPSGINDSINPHIDSTTKAVFSSSGVTNPSGKTYGYGNASELANLSVEQLFMENPWYNAKGVYIIPEGQSVTRFAFVSTCEYSLSLGNLLDNITFSTLIGNLNASFTTSGDVKVTGYWGDDVTTKKLVIKIGDSVNEIDMSSVSNSNFTMTVPASLIGEASKIEVYHQDYESAKRTLTIEGDPTDDPVEPGKKGLSGGAIAGIVIGILFLLLLIIYILGYFFLYRKGKLDDKAIRVIYKWLPRGKENLEQEQSNNQE